MKTLWMTIVVAVALLPSITDAGPFSRLRARQVELVDAPEDGNRPWRLVFTSDAWQQNELEALAVYTLERLGDQEGAVRPQHITPKNPLFAQYQNFHQNDLPCIVVIVPDGNGGISEIPTNIHGSTLPATPEEIFKEIRLSANDDGPTEDDVKGRLFNPHQPPFWWGPNRWRHRNGLCPVCQGWHPNNQPHQPAPQPPPRITRLPRVGDSVIAGRLKKLEELAKKIDKGKVAKAVAKVALGSINPALPMGVAGILGMLGGIIGGIRRRSGGFLEEDE